MSAIEESYGDPSDWIHCIAQEIEALALRGEIQEGGMVCAFYRSSEENVAYLEARAWPDSSLNSSVQAGLLIEFKDGSSYDMTWAEGTIWSLSHSARSRAAGRDLSLTLPYSNGRLRHEYVSEREYGPATEARSYLNMRNVLVEGMDGEPFVAESDVDGFIKQVMQRLRESKEDPNMDILNVYAKDIDPNDIDLHDMLGQVHALDPLTDQVDPELILTVELDPADYAYMATQEKRISKALDKLVRQGKPEEEICERHIEEMSYLNRISAHTGKQLVVKSNNIRRLDNSKDDELASVKKVTGILRSFIFTHWQNEETGEAESGLMLMIELSEPYDKDEFPDIEGNPFHNSVAFVPANSIQELRRYHSFTDYYDDEEL